MLAKGIGNSKYDYNDQGQKFLEVLSHKYGVLTLLLEVGARGHEAGVLSVRQCVPLRDEALWVVVREERVRTSTFRHSQDLYRDRDFIL